MNAVLLVETNGPVTTLTLHRPDKRNALNLELLSELQAALREAETNPAQRILVVRGAGPVFCAGLDLAEAARHPAHIAAEQVEAVLRQLATTRLMTVAAVQGAAVAGGAGLMIACDFVVATRDAKFGFPEVRRGIVPALVMTLLRRQLREREARELLLLGKLGTAEHAHAIGLINRIVEDEAGLNVEIQSIIAALLQGGPATLAETKHLLSALWPAPFDADLARARAVHVSSRATNEAIEGVAAFNEKRPPRWAPPSTTS